MADFFCSAVLCCALLCCTLLYCAVLCCPVLCVLSGRQTAISRPEIPISRQEKNGGQHEKTCRVRSQFSLCLTERTLTRPAAASCSRSVRRIALSAMPRGKVPSPIARIPEKLTSNGQAERKFFSGRSIKSVFIMLIRQRGRLKKKRSFSTAEKKRMQRFHIASSFLCVIRASVRRR